MTEVARAQPNAVWMDMSLDIEHMASISASWSGVDVIVVSRVSYANFIGVLESRRPS